MKTAFLVMSALFLAGCASQPARPVLYPNAKLKESTENQVRADTNECIALAEASGAESKDSSKTGQGLAQGAAVGAAVGGVASALRGRSVGAGLVGGAAVGGTAGAVRGSFRANEVSPVHRNFVQRCMHDRGYDVIGWK